MNNIELRLYSEKNWREENFLKMKSVKTHNTKRTFVKDIIIPLSWSFGFLFMKY